MHLRYAERLCADVFFVGFFSTGFGFRAGFVGAGILLIYFSSRRLRKRLQTTGEIYKKVADGRRVGLGRPCGLPQAHPLSLLHAGMVCVVSALAWRSSPAGQQVFCSQISARVAQPISLCLLCNLLCFGRFVDYLNAAPSSRAKKG